MNMTEAIQLLEMIEEIVDLAEGCSELTTLVPETEEEEVVEYTSLTGGAM